MNAKIHKGAWEILEKVHSMKNRYRHRYMMTHFNEIVSKHDLVNNTRLVIFFAQGRQPTQATLTL